MGIDRVLTDQDVKDDNDNFDDDGFAQPKTLKHMSRIISEEFEALDSQIRDDLDELLDMGEITKGVYDSLIEQLDSDPINNTY